MISKMFNLRTGTNSCSSYKEWPLPCIWFILGGALGIKLELAIKNSANLMGQFERKEKLIMFQNIQDEIADVPNVQLSHSKLNYCAKILRLYSCEISLRYITHICSISLRCDPSWLFNGETKCR